MESGPVSTDMGQTFFQILARIHYTGFFHYAVCEAQRLNDLPVNQRIYLRELMIYNIIDYDLHGPIWKRTTDSRLLELFAATFLEMAVGWFRAWYPRMFVLPTAKFILTNDGITYALKCAFCDTLCHFDFWLTPLSYDDEEHRVYKPHVCPSNTGLGVARVINDKLPGWISGNVVRY